MRIVLKEIEFEDINIYKFLSGEFGENLESIARLLNIEISSRGTKIFLKGEEKKVSIAEKAIRELYKEVEGGLILTRQDIEEKVLRISEGREREEPIIITYRGKKVYPKNPRQKEYIKAIEENTIVFGIGPAGTGKTYLAVAMAIKYLKEKRVAKLVITRPAVEAGEKIGFLPGGIMEKVDPYLRPIYDSIFDILDWKEASRLMEKGIIEVVPIAFMRGRTLSDAFIIIDEAQNLTYEQLKMSLTRLGLESKLVLTADLTQSDIQNPGLRLVKDELEKIEGIKFVYFTKEDVVRHPIVTKIIEAFEKWEERNRRKDEEGKRDDSEKNL